MFCGSDKCDNQQQNQEDEQWLIVNRLLTLVKYDDLTIEKEAKTDNPTVRSPRGDRSSDRQNEADDK